MRQVRPSHASIRGVVRRPRINAHEHLVKRHRAWELSSSFDVCWRSLADNPLGLCCSTGLHFFEVFPFFVLNRLHVLFLCVCRFCTDFVLAGTLTAAEANEGARGQAQGDEDAGMKGWTRHHQTLSQGGKSRGSSRAMIPVWWWAGHGTDAPSLNRRGLIDPVG